jgi:serine/threonine protein kinase
MAKLSKYKLKEYQYGVDVRKGRQLYMMSEKKIYFGEWLIGTTDQIIIIEMSEQIADREAPFYLEANGHENIIRTFGSIGNPSNLTIFIQEFAPEGDLADCLMDNQFQFTQTMLVQMFAQIADAMSYVASKKIVHGDLGCRNVLVFRVDSNRPRNNLVKITDFGLARWIEHPPENEDPTLIPVRYCAPEILRHNHHLSYSEKSDVYSMGVLIWEALSNSEIPYSSVDKDEDVKYKKLNNERLQAPKPCDRQLWVLMNSCWHRDPQKRPTFDEIKDILVEIKISEVSHDLITASSHKYGPKYSMQK